MGGYAGIQYVDKKEMYLASAIFVFGIIALMYIIPIIIYPFSFAWGAFKKWRFSSKLNRKAKKQGYKVTKLNGVLASMFKAYVDADLLLQKIKAGLL